MQKLVIDTNVLVSALIQESYPYLIVSLFCIDDDIQWCISDDVLTEYEDVLKRPKFSKYPGFAENAENLLKELENNGKKFTPTINPHCSLTSQRKVIISGL